MAHTDPGIRRLQEAFDQVSAEVTEEYLIPALRRAGVENPERYVLRYELSERETVQGTPIGLAPEQQAYRDQIMADLDRARLGATNEP